jgi:alcohol dehydrogenase (cytochrome c)
MAEARGTLYVPWIDLCFKASATGLVHGGPVPPVTGGLAAINTTTGHIQWTRTFNEIDAGAATVANNIVFTSTYKGTVYALSTRTGRTLWQNRSPTGINSFPAVTRTMLIIGPGAPTSATKPAHGELIAYSLPQR